MVTELSIDYLTDAWLIVVLVPDTDEILNGKVDLDPEYQRGTPCFT